MGEVAGRAVSGMVWLDKGGNAPGDVPEGFPVRAVWDISSSGETLPPKVRLKNDGGRMTEDIALENFCRNFPAEALKRLGVSPKQGPPPPPGP